MVKVVVTGAGGFAGRELVKALASEGHSVTAVVRRPAETATPGVTNALVAEIDGTTDWSPILADADVVVHAAARAHVLRPEAGEDERVLRTNVDGTRRLAADCAATNVRTLVFLSSIAVYDPGCGIKSALKESDPLNPATVYGRSKKTGEALVGEFARLPGRAAISLRPPLIYGAGAPGNWGRLEKLARLPVPLPFGAIRNRRSMLGLANLADAVCAVLRSHVAGNVPSGAYNLADGDIVSLGEIIAALRDGSGRAGQQIAVAPAILAAAFKVIGKSAEFEKFAGDLTVDAGAFTRTFGWTPPNATLDGIRAAARASG